MNGTKGQSKTGEAEQAADDLERGGSGPAGQNGPGEGQDASDKPRKADGVQSSSESDPAKSEHMRSVIRDALQDDEQRETEAAREVVRINVKGVSNVQRAVATGMTESDAEIEIS